MKKTAIVLATGFEEGEALTIIDIIRRSGFVCDIFGVENTVCSSHEIVVQVDKLLTDEIIDYDMVILPGGMLGAANLQNNELVIEYVKQMNIQGKYIAAICAAPIVLDKAGILKGKSYTAYIGYNQKITEGIYLEDTVVIDQNIITSRGPATTYAFAYKLVEILGGDALAVQNRMLYFNVFDVKEEQ